MKQATVVTTCRCCGNKKLIKYLNLGLQPLANSYHTGEKLNTFPLEVNLCSVCYHSQLSVVVDPEVMFKNYLYVSGTTETFRNHCRKLAEDAVGRVKEHPNVLDIACNDGTQLEYFRELGCKITGVDPAENLRPITESKKIHVEVDYWTLTLAKKLGVKYDLITGTNVFAHVNDAYSFLQAAKFALKKDGILILEFPYAEKMITHNEFDTVYHEHLSYFLVHSFSRLIERVDMHIIDIIQTPIHGGSIRFFVKSGKKPHASKVSNLINTEKNNGLLDLATYREFTKRVQDNKKTMIILAKKIRASGRKLIGYGASAKGNTMLNYFQLNLDYIVDDNELKWNYYTPGMNILILPPRAISLEKNHLSVVVLSWNFYKEIAKKIIHLRDKKTGDASILYVPATRVMKLAENKDLSVSA